MTMHKNRTTVLIALCSLFALAAHPAKAGLIDWTDWTSTTPGSIPGTVGTPFFITATGTAGATTVTYTGDSIGVTTTGTGLGSWAPQTTYQSAGVLNAPGTPDIVRIGEGGDAFTQTITFSQSVTNPVMAIVSLGTPSTASTQWSFNAPFSILSSGLGAFGGGGVGSFTALPGNILQGAEGNGVIQFNGTFNSLSWTATNSEHWTGFTVGVASAPEPGTLGLLALGMVGGIAARRRGRAR
jgi:PEP-CTERM motif